MPAWHAAFRSTYDELRWARNDVIHQGAYARTVTDHAVELLIILEDTLMSNASIVSQFMVREVVEAQLWHPLSYVRQQMLKHAFSHIPIRVDGQWFLIPEWSIARHLRSAPSRTKRKESLLESVSDVMKSGKLTFSKAETVSPATKISDAVELIEERPLLVVDSNHDNALLGILTSSDVL
jgi:CBS domain-containing protein